MKKIRVITCRRHAAVKHRRRRRRRVDPFFLNVVYPGMPDHELEKRIKVVLGRYSDGSGYDFINDERDLSFGFKNRTQAILCARRVKKIKGVERVTVEGRIWP